MATRDLERQDRDARRELRARQIHEHGPGARGLFSTGAGRALALTVGLLFGPTIAGLIALRPGEPRRSSGDEVLTWAPYALATAEVAELRGVDIETRAAS